MYNLTFKGFIASFVIIFIFLTISVFCKVNSEKYNKNKFAVALFDSISNVSSIIVGTIIVFVFILRFLPKKMNEQIKEISGL